MKVIGVSGKAYSGKDTIAEMVAELMRGPDQKVVRVGFADALKEECRALGWDGKKDDAGRALLQRVGVERRAQQSDYWIRKAFEKMTDPETLYIVPDVRFQNEADAIRAAGGQVWRVTRFDSFTGEPFDNGLSAEAKAHVSETDLDHYDFDRYFTNLSFGGLRSLLRTALQSL